MWWIYEVPEPACSHTDQLPIHMDADVVCLHAICVWLVPGLWIKGPYMP